jgi:hypothetical protein
MRRALLFAAGSGKRWESEPLPKQLTEVEGEIIIDRTIRQLTERDIPSTVITSDPRLVRKGAAFYEPLKKQWLVETILHTRELWHGDMIGIFGDVWFEDATLDVLCDQRGLKFVGRQNPSVLTCGPPELWGFTWDDSSAAKLAEALQVGLDDARSRPPGCKDHLAGSIWQPYRHIDGVVDLQKHSIGHRGHWVEAPNDWTDDFDDPGRFKLWKERRRRRFVNVGA